VSTSAVVNQLVELSPAEALQQCQARVSELKRELARSPCLSIYLPYISLHLPISRYISQAHVSELKRELAMHDQLAHRSAVQYDPFTEAQQAEVRQQVRAFLDDEVDDLAPSSLRHAREIFAQFKALHREQAKRAAAAATAGAAGAAGAAGGPSRHAAPMGASQQSRELEMRSDELELQGRVEVITGLGEQEFVGELTGGDVGGAPEGFSCGEAPDAARPAVPTADLLPARPRTEAERSGGARAESAGQGPASPADAAAEKALAYEEFKRGQGLELASLLTEHKAALREKRARVRHLASEVNAAKDRIDELRTLLDHKAAQRAGISASVGDVGREGGGEEVDVIDEEEFAWLTQCKQAKAKYRQHFEELREVRSDAEYTATLIENTRAQLLADFDTWLQAW
jgi:kinesin family protein 6/9